MTQFPHFRITLSGFAAVLALVILACASTNSLAQQSKPVEVVNSAAAPVPTYNVDAAVTQPVHDECVGTIPDGTAISGDVVPAIPCLSKFVPAGKRLVIEFVTANVVAPSGQRPGVLIGTSTNGFPSGGSGVDHEIALGASPGNGFDIHTASVPVKLYANPGSEVQIIVTRDQTVDSLVFDVTWSGMLVDVN